MGGYVLESGLGDQGYDYSWIGYVRAFGMEPGAINENAPAMLNDRPLTYGDLYLLNTPDTDPRQPYHELMNNYIQQLVAEEIALDSPETFHAEECKLPEPPLHTPPVERAAFGRF